MRLYYWIFIESNLKNDPIFIFSFQHLNIFLFIIQCEMFHSELRNISLKILWISHLENFSNVKVFNKGRILACFRCMYSKMHIAHKGINIRKQPSILIQSREALILSVFLRKTSIVVFRYCNRLFQLPFWSCFVLIYFIAMT